MLQDFSRAVPELAARVIPRSRVIAGYGDGVQCNRLYRDGVLEAEDFDPADISDRICEQGVVVWLDLVSPDQAELALLAEEFSLNALAVEDATHDHERPKVDHYSTHIFLSLTAFTWTSAPANCAPANWQSSPPTTG